jgi:exonuclease SbcC
MIPLYLKLTNFMPYRSAELNFSGVHIGCLTGDNGAGKSSILDAVTWALWGRSRSKRDDELVHQGQTEMQVEFTFALGSNAYRVIRARKAGKKTGAGMLDLQVAGPHPQPLPRSTQNVEQGRGDPPSPVDSFFIDGGRVGDGGSWRTLAEPQMPATQQKIIDLLRLDYDTFINSAFLLQGRADEFTVKTATERKKVLADILGLDIWEQYEARAKAKIAAIENELRLIDLRLNEIDAEAARQPQFEAEVAAAQKAVIELGDKLREAESKYQQAQQAQRSIGLLDAQLSDLVKRITQAERELAATDSDLNSARQKSDDRALSKELADMQARIEIMSQREVRRDELRQRKSDLNEEAAALRGQNERLVPEVEPFKSRIALLESSTEPLCPTCGQPLTSEHRQQVVAELNAEVETRRQLFRDNKARLDAIKPEATALDSDLVALDSELHQLPALHRRAAELQAAIESARVAAKSIEGLAQRRLEWQSALSADRQKQEEIAAQIGAARAGLGDFAAIQADYDRTRADEARARQQLGAAEQKLAACEAMLKQREVKQAERKQWAEEKGIYEELRLAFGKKGAPAMIIEAAIPEIEDEANVLLTKITSGRMHVRFDTQRETVKGDTVETLEIKIADELGTRPYENYSGGEQFRVNFAIRIALSKLLARRAGAQLQTLVIDEGFGALDSTGRDKLVEAINAVQDDFQRILIITHLDELRDAFPVRIEVTKTANGSQIDVV